MNASQGQSPIMNLSCFPISNSTNHVGTELTIGTNTSTNASEACSTYPVRFEARSGYSMSVYGKNLFVGSWGWAEMWDTSSGALARLFTFPTMYYVSHIFASSHGLFTADDFDCGPMLWNISTGDLIMQVEAGYVYYILKSTIRSQIEDPLI